MRVIRILARVVGVVVVAGLLVALIKSLPDIERYRSIRSM